jgi:hypothetical protein
LPAELGVTELRILATLLLAPLTKLEAPETTEAAEPVTPPATLEALAETPEAEPVIEADIEPLMESELAMAEASKLLEAEGALMVLESDPEADVVPQVCCWS